MSVGLEELLASFDRLPHDEQEQAANEIWRRLHVRGYEPISSEAMLEITEQGFRRLDEEEEPIGKSQAW